MKPFNTLLLSALVLASALFIGGCVDSLTSTDVSEEFATVTRSSESVRTTPLLRNPQLLEAAYSKVTSSLGKRRVKTVEPIADDPVTSEDLVSPEDPYEPTFGTGTTTDSEPTIVAPDLYVFIGYNGYEPDGITPRILDDYGITQRVLEEYGVTRRVLEDYGITQRVLEEYGVTRRVIEEYGITQRVLEDYGITQRLLDEYGLTWEDFLALCAAYDPSMKLRTTLDGGISVWIRGEDVDSILSEMLDDSDIDYVEPDPEANFVGTLGSTNLTRTNSGQYFPWGVMRIGGGLNPNTSGGGIHVYVLDSGAMTSDVWVASMKDFTMLFLNRDQDVHEENDWTNPGYFDPGTSGNPEDESGHGTHIIGTIGAIDNNQGIIGTLPGVRIHSLKVLTAEGRTDVTTLVAALNYVIYQRENVHNVSDRVLVNLSLGMDIGTTAYNVLDETVKKAVEAGIIVVVAAGNNGQDVSTYSPAHVSEAITVGAYDQNDTFVKFSNWGSGVDILAPGNDVVSLPGNLTDYQNNILNVRSGTSMAAPHVTAAAASLWMQDPSLTPAEVEKALVDYGDDVVTGTPAGTTNRGVMVSNPDAHGITYAGYNPKNGRVDIRGRGTINSTLELRTPVTNTVFAVVVTDGDGLFYMMERTKDVPCALYVSSDRTATATELAGAPSNCFN